jgi:HD-GYP domain-containing protein (c-di-GMP phosphodiesterase class II)
MATSDQTNFDKIIKITRELLQLHDLDMLLERMLTEVRNVVNADAGSIYLVEGSNLKFSYTQNNTLQKKLPFGKKLIYSTFSIQINNNSIAGYVANTGMLVNIPDAYRIDSFQPYSFDKYFDETTGYRTQSTLAVAIKNSLGKVTGVIQLINSLDLNQSIRPFTATEESIVQMFADSTAIAIEQAQMMRSMIVRINKMLKLHDPTETAAHNNRIAAYSIEVYEVWARKKGIPKREIQHNCDILRMAAMLHDIGKIAIPSHILKKPYAELDPEEMKIFRQHVIYGAHLFPNVFSAFEEMAQAISLNHHENWDGSGYPGHIRIEDGLPLPGYEKTDGSAFGKSGNEIPIYARIVAVANEYDDLIHRATEKPGKDIKSVAIEKILAGAGKQFDPDVVAAFIGCLEVIDSIGTRYPDQDSDI